MNRFHERFPLCLYKAAHFLRLQNNLENRSYSFFSDAAKACAGTGYEQQELLDCISMKTRNFVGYLAAQPYPPIDMRTIRTPLGIALARQGDDLNVIDFGGACGIHYFLARKLPPERIHLSWHVLETDGMCSRGKEFENDELRFYSNLSAARKFMPRLDLIFCSGALQYSPDPYHQLQELVQCDARNIFLTRTALTTGHADLIAVQRSMFSANGLGDMPHGIRDKVARYPLYIAQKEKFERILSGRYEIRFIFSKILVLTP